MRNSMFFRIASRSLYDRGIKKKAISMTKWYHKHTYYTRHQVFSERFKKLYLRGLMIKKIKINFG